MQNYDNIFEDKDGNKFYYLNGLLHRIDGPAMEFSDTSKLWFIDNKEYSFKDWLGLVWEGLSAEEKKRYIYEGL